MKNHPPRGCAVCGDLHPNLLYRQRFSQMSSGCLIDGYDVVSCTSCGFVFADRLPDQEEFDRYYQEMSKYEYHDTAGKESEYDAARFHKLINTLLPVLPDKSSRIIDIGCATGKLLSLLKESGYPNVYGLDPSPGCARAAFDLHDVQVLIGSIADLPRIGQTWDCIILSGVLEHIYDLRTCISSLRSQLSEEGIICISVPDASRFYLWPDAPFQQFSVEHINFFSPVSLQNLIQSSGLEQIVSALGVHPETATTIVPFVTSIFGKIDGASRALVFDENSERGIREYLRQSAETERLLFTTIASLVDEGAPIVVWGAGTHTLHLLETTALRKANITAFVDSNKSYQDKQLCGIQILPPEALKSMSETILVSSRVFQDEIVRKIHDHLRLPNRVITLYNIGVPEVPLAVNGVAISENHL